MDVLLRDVNALIVHKIDREAKLQGLSRNAYLVSLLERFSALEEFKTYEGRYRLLEEKTLRVLQDNTALLTQIQMILKGGEPQNGAED